MRIEREIVPQDAVAKGEGSSTGAPPRDQVEAALAAAPVGRAVKLMLGDAAIWIKRPRHSPGYVMYGLQLAAAILLALPVLRPPRVSRGAAGLAAEASRLRRLQRRSWPVPEVVDVTERWLAITDIGPSLDKVVAKLAPAERAKILRGGLQRLQRLHGEGGWHGGAKISNVTLGPAGYGFIDFEDDLEPSMPLVQRQARDVLLFIMRAARFSDRDPTLMTALIEDAHRAASPEVDAELKAIGLRVARLSRLTAPVLQHLGREGRALARIGEVYRRG